MASEGSPPNPPRRSGSMVVILLVAAITIAAVVSAILIRRHHRKEGLAKLDQRPDEKSPGEPKGSGSPAKKEHPAGKPPALAEEVSPEMQAKIRKITAEHRSQTQRVMEPYLALIKRTESIHPFDFTTVKTKEELEERRAIGEEMLARNTELMNELTSRREDMLAALAREGVEGREREKFMREFDLGYKTGLPIESKIRDCDVTIAYTLMEASRLLSATWGKWKVQERQLIFEDVAANDQYRALIDRMTSAQNEQAEAQSQLLEVLKKLREPN